MSCLPAGGFSVSGSSSLIVNNREKGSPPPRASSSIGGLQFRSPNSKEIWGNTLDFPDQRGFSNLSNKAPNLDPVYVSIFFKFWFWGQIWSFIISNCGFLLILKAQGATISFGKTQKWWEKSLQPNMIEIDSAQELVEHLRNAGDRLVVLNFFSPGCGGCKALHPKVKIWGFY